MGEEKRIFWNILNFLLGGSSMYSLLWVRNWDLSVTMMKYLEVSHNEPPVVMHGEECVFGVISIREYT